MKLYEKILPVCMYCKDIRDDSGAEPGKGKRLYMEPFLYKKSGVDISHTLCPRCEARAKKELPGE